MDFIELYNYVTKQTANNLPIKDSIKNNNQLNCLLNPQNFAPVWSLDKCDCKDNGKCAIACPFNAIKIEDNIVKIDKNCCVGCGECVKACPSQNLVFSKDTITAINLLKLETPTFALLAPAFVGQFDGVSVGQLRSALKKIGFWGVIEVATFADIITLKEALEFKTYHIDNYQLTSCCCPIWIALINKQFSALSAHLPQSASPMVVAGRIIKKLVPTANTIFIGPCQAKKAEAKNVQNCGIDCVLTFEELKDMFDVFNLNLSNLKEENKQHSSSAGRIYAKSGGVSQAIATTVTALDSALQISYEVACGVPNCKKLLENILLGNTTANFFEGMACPNGCIGGAKNLLPSQQTEAKLVEYANSSPYATPAQNPYVIYLLDLLGYTNINDFLENCDLLKS
ncbi:MAG: [Fe-Fe] hydrogenase large subunit C-terminal domain-containing protein [Clostridia bacterium]